MRLPRHSTIAAYASLFIALGGTSYAAVTLKANSVTGREIKAKSVHLSDLASDARPSSKSKAFRAAVSEVILDPNTQAVVNSLSDAVKGEKGDLGPQGATVQGPEGKAGASGEKGDDGVRGPRGAALGFAHVSAGGIVDPEHTSSNAVVVKPSGTAGTYCVKAVDGVVKNVAVSLDANDGLSASPLSRVPPAGGACEGYDFEVIVVHDVGSGTYTSLDHGLFVTLN